MSKYNSNLKKNHLKVINDLLKLEEGVHEIYAEVTHRKIFEQLQKQYGRASKKCFCRIFRERCVKNNGICDFANKGADSWRDHGLIFQNEDKYTFISHPYRISNKAFKDINRICNEYNLNVEIDSRESSWFPSQTTAIIITKD